MKQSVTPSPRVFSGVQPSGRLHLGNYLGALVKFVALQEQYECLFCVVDLHAITVPQPKGLLASNTREIAAAYLAAGVDPAKAIIFVQSAVAAHTELAWILNCTARMGWLERMTQFKDKAGKDKERASVGLFGYPVLQAADILAYKATHVPVGEDQKQHLELSRDIAERFNREHDAPGFFPSPEPLIQGPGARIMSLKDGAVKMSKSDPSDLSRINLDDTPEQITKKIKKARTDPDGVPSSEQGLQDRPGARNLIGIYAAIKACSTAQVLAEYGGQGWGQFKPALAELLVAELAPVSQRFAGYQNDPAELDKILADGAARADAIAAPIMQEVRDIIGFWKG
ncbi:Tryptophanyl-tRNA synthetase [hydrothermal vent metagenome]|uniref:tryptophan--tRNA ligase n=1 Tax=hydrothermal vent metagenome TaxID=652676 RepID=A0A3B0RS06_9ZZZZ